MHAQVSAELSKARVNGFRSLKGVFVSQRTSVCLLVRARSTHQ